MTTFYLVFAIAGGALLTIQLVMGLVGAADIHLPGFGDAGHDGDVHAGDALDLLSFRALTAGAVFFGLVGLLTLGWGLGVFSLLPAFLAGGAATVAMAWVLRAMNRMESDGAERLEHAVGQSGTVYLGIPAARAGAGKVHITLAGRLVECRAQAEAELPSGASVLVVDVVGPDLVEVIPSPQIGAQ